MSDSIKHYGIPGMKWGIRKKIVRGSNSKNNTIEVENRKEALKNRRSLTDQDLQKKIQRLRAEKEYKDLVESDIAPGKKAAKKILSESGKLVVTTVTVGSAFLGIRKLLKKKGLSDNDIDIILRNKK